MPSREVATSWVGELAGKSGLAFDPPPKDLPEGAKHWAVYNSGNKPIKVIVTMLLQVTEELLP